MAPANPSKRPFYRHLRALGVAAIAFASGCGAPCERLRAFVCDGRGEEYCTQVDGFLDTVLVGEGGAKLEGASREEACRVVLGNVELQNAYRHKAKEKLLGEPYWEVAKNRKPAEDAKSEAKSDEAKADAPK